MIVQIVLVIVTAVRVNSQELCPSVCQCDCEQATCADLFSDVTNMTPDTFHCALRRLRVTGNTRLEVEEDLFLRWNFTSLTILDLSQNNITKIWQRAFYSLAYLEELDLSGNSITTLHSHTFYSNIGLFRLSLAQNSITDIHLSTFRNNIQLIDLDISGNKIASIHKGIFKNIAKLVRVKLADNRITDIHPSTFGNNSRLEHLDMSGNKISSIHPDTFIHNTEFELLDMKGNSITFVHPSTFRNNGKIKYLDLSTNLLNLIHSDTFQYNVNLKFLSLRKNKILDISNTGFLSGINPTYLDLSGNMLRYVDNSVFRKQGQLETLILSENMLQSLEPGIFRGCTNLRNLSLSANNISQISTSAFHGLVQLELLDVSNNNIVTLNSPLFVPFLIITNRHNHQLPKLKNLNLSQNKIRFLSDVLYSMLSTNSVTSDPTYQLVSLNVSSNRLDWLDATSVRWLKHTAAVTDLSGNPWRCECSALGKAWRELRHKLTLNCASPEDRRGRTWDVLEEDLCPDIIRSVDIPNTVKLNLSLGFNPNITRGTDHAVSIPLIVIGVLVALCKCCLCFHRCAATKETE